LTRTDLPPPGTLGPALAWSTLVDRTVSPDTATAVVHGLLISRGIRRVAVVTADGSLLGLMCLKQRRTGFCSDADVAARSDGLVGEPDEVVADGAGVNETHGLCAAGLAEVNVQNAAAISTVSCRSRSVAPAAYCSR
jgi:hypothetical protein